MALIFDIMQTKKQKTGSKRASECCARYLILSCMHLIPKYLICLWFRGELKIGFVQRHQ